MLSLGPRRLVPGWEALSQAERDRAYDNMAAVAGSATLRDARLARSRCVRALWGGHLDLSYGTGGRNRWDIYPGEREKPCLVFIHGGYWQRNDREGFACLVEGLGRHGWSVALPGYTLAPQARLSCIVGEIGAALDWFAENRRAHGVNGSILLAGWSAGATLAALHADHPTVDAVLAISGIYDLAELRETGFNRALRLSDEEVESLSPLRLSPPRRSPAILVVGERELPALVAHSQAMAEHVRHWEMASVAGADHFTIVDDLATADGFLVRTARRLMEGISPD